MILKKQLLAERELLIKALEFYANEANWVSQHSKGYKLHNPTVDSDMGKKARTVLKEISS